MEAVAFNEMFQSLQARISALDPRDVAEKAGVEWDADASGWRFVSFGQEVFMEFPSLLTQPTLEMWHLLTALQYLELADGALTDMSPMLFGEQEDGLVRGGGFDRKVEQQMRTVVGKLSPAVVAKRCETLGGTPVKTNADLAYELRFMPRYPVTVKVWFADEDDPASGRLLLPRSANHYLPVEPSLFVGEMIMNALMASE